MQKNYEQLIDHIGQLIRNPEATGDEFAKVHLYSWFVGSRAVVIKTKKLLKANNVDKKNDSLEDLLFAMRKDLGLDVSGEFGPFIGIFRNAGYLTKNEE